MSDLGVWAGTQPKRSVLCMFVCILCLLILIGVAFVRLPFWMGTLRYIGSLQTANTGHSRPVKCNRVASVCSTCSCYHRHVLCTSSNRVRLCSPPRPQPLVPIGQTPTPICRLGAHSRNVQDKCYPKTHPNLSCTSKPIRRCRYAHSSAALNREGPFSPSRTLQSSI